MTELSKTLSEAHYSDLIEVGGLREGVTRALEAAGSSLRATTVPAFIPFARVGQGSRFTQIYAAAGRRLFTLEFWFDGVAYGSGSTPDVGEAAASAHAWALEGPGIALMKERFGFFTPSGRGEAHEAGSLVEYLWGELLRRWEDSDRRHGGTPSPTPLIRAAMLRPELRRLYPYTSLYSLGFSRTGYPFTNDCPSAAPHGDGLYRAYSHRYEVVKRRHRDREYQVTEHEILGEGTVEEVLDLLVADLPPGRGAAANGTPEDVSNAGREGV
ncbi:MAG TPA: DUF6193 family natural product biosynthesis protein [Pyrinomonadaceae bacterium]